MAIPKNYGSDPEFQSVIVLHKEVDDGLRELEARGMPSDYESKEELTVNDLNLSIQYFFLHFSCFSF